MPVVNDLLDIFLPVLSHWIIWLAFFVVVSIILLLYAYPYIKKHKKEYHSDYIGLPIASVISLYIFTKLLEGVIYHGSILKVDAWVNQIIFTLYFPWITNAARIITTFGNGYMIAFLFTVCMVILLSKKRWRYALLSTAAILGSVVLQVAIKALVHRARPANLIETGYSFPSGHAITAIVFVSLLIYSFKDDFKNRKIRYVLIILFSSFFTTVAISRILLHVHWFSDVMAGISLGLFWFMSLVLVERAITGLAPAVKRETKQAAPIIPTPAKS
jgi:membrane-associated phospholipid phosphatase